MKQNRTKYVNTYKEYKYKRYWLDLYFDECWTLYNTKTGNKPTWSLNTQSIYKFKYREYRTWKYNRKTQWKQN